MNKLGIKSVVCKKFRHFTSKKKEESKENILSRDFSTTDINQKWTTDIINLIVKGNKNLLFN